MHIASLIHQLLPLLYRSAGNPALWTACLTQLCEATEARMAVVLACDDQENLAFLQHAGMDAAAQKACADRFLQSISPCKVSVQAHPDTGPDSDGEGQPRQPDALHHLHQADVPLGKLPGFSRASLTLLRSAKKAAFSAEELATLQQLVPHLEGALLLQRQFTSLRQGGGLLERVSRSFDLAYILLDSLGRPHLISPAAQRLIAEGCGLQVRNGKLQAGTSREQVRLYQLLASACGSGLEPHKGASGETTMMVGRSGLKKPLHLALQPLHTASEASCAVLFLRDPGAQPASRAAVLRQLYSLLPSEVRLAESLADGLDVKHAALRMHITENSARTLLKGVFRKLDVKSQSGLVRTVLTLPAE